MKPDDVPDEWAEPLAMAMSNAQCRVLYSTEPYNDLAVWRSVSNYEILMKRARHALAAVIPLAVAEEREACARLAEAFPARTHGALATAPYAAAEQAADEIAAAIRARGEPR